MKQAKLVGDVKQFSDHTTQQLFQIDPVNIPNIAGVLHISVEYIIVSACDRAKRLAEVPENVRRDLSRFGANLDPNAPENQIFEVKIFPSDKDGTAFSPAIHLFCLENSLSIEDCVKAFGYEVVRESSPFDEA
jgi:hypothetical protein